MCMLSAKIQAASSENTVMHCATCFEPKLSPALPLDATAVTWREQEHRPLLFKENLREYASVHQHST